MKKTFYTLALGLFLAFGLQSAKAQTPYNSALGIVFDGHDGSNIGIQYKKALTNTSAAQFQVAFREHWFSFGADWQYEQAIPDLHNLAWYVGIGANVGLWSYKSNSEVFLGLRPQLGLEYKIPSAPLAMHVDYKPTFGLNHDAGFNGGGFTFGIKYVLK